MLPTAMCSGTPVNNSSAQAPISPNVKVKQLALSRAASPRGSISGTCCARTAVPKNKRRRSKVRRILFRRLSRRFWKACEDCRDAVNVRTYFAFGFKLLWIDFEKSIDFFFVSPQRFAKMQSLRLEQQARRTLMVERTRSRIGNLDRNGRHYWPPTEKYGTSVSGRFTSPRISRNVFAAASRFVRFASPFRKCWVTVAGM